MNGAKAWKRMGTITVLELFSLGEFAHVVVKISMTPGLATCLRGTTRLPGKTTPILCDFEKNRRSNMHHQTIDLPCTDQFIPVYQ